jgi:hypothetical protein
MVEGHPDKNGPCLQCTVPTIVLDCVHRFAYEPPWHSALGRNTFAGGRPSGTDIDHESIDDFGGTMHGAYESFSSTVSCLYDTCDFGSKYDHPKPI